MITRTHWLLALGAAAGLFTTAISVAQDSPAEAGGGAGTLQPKPRGASNADPVEPLRSDPIKTLPANPPAAQSDNRIPDTLPARPDLPIPNTKNPLATPSTYGSNAPTTGPATTPEANVATQGIVELTRGPIHEGFAETVSVSPKAGPVYPTAPPEIIDEQPASIRAEGSSSIWLAGYWDWDVASKNYIWITGTWRVPPYNHNWVPGYWTQVQGGYQRVPGFWTVNSTTEVAYLPEPPAYQDEGVDIANPPAPDQFWVPGNWAYMDNDYSWRPGYWANSVPNWMWIAAHYVWSPNGYVFVNGYWDQPFDQRGLLFAPVAFTSPVYQQAGFVYTPSIYLDLGAISANLFVGPSVGSYYFGDYYGPQFASLGIVPWYSVGTAGFVYDPIFAYNNVVFSRSDRAWRNEWRSRHDLLVRTPDRRPAHTIIDQRRLADRGNRDVLIGRSVRDAFNDNVSNGARRFARVDADRRSEAIERARNQREITRERSAFEAAVRNNQDAQERRSFKLPSATPTPAPAAANDRRDNDRGDVRRDGTATPTPNPAVRDRLRDDNIRRDNQPPMRRGGADDNPPRINNPNPNRGAAPAFRPADGSVAPIVPKTGPAGADRTDRSKSIGPRSEPIVPRNPTAGPNRGVTTEPLRRLPDAAPKATGRETGKQGPRMPAPRTNPTPPNPVGKGNAINRGNDRPALRGGPPAAPNVPKVAPRANPSPPKAAPAKPPAPPKAAPAKPAAPPKDDDRKKKD